MLLYRQLKKFTVLFALMIFFVSVHHFKNTIIFYLCLIFVKCFAFAVIKKNYYKQDEINAEAAMV